MVKVKFMWLKSDQDKEWRKVYHCRSKANKRIINTMNSFTAKTVENLYNIENLFERQIIKTYTGRNREQNSLIGFFKIYNV